MTVCDVRYLLTCVAVAVLANIGTARAQTDDLAARGESPTSRMQRDFHHGLLGAALDAASVGSHTPGIHPLAPCKSRARHRSRGGLGARQDSCHGPLAAPPAERTFQVQVQAQGEGARAAASDWGPLSGRLSFHVNVAFQASSQQLGETTSFRAYGEPATFQTQHDVAGGVLVDVGGSILTWRQLAVGASYTQLNGSDTATVTGTVPHPLDFNNPRTVPPQTEQLEHRERATHVYASWFMPLTDKVDVAVFGGPTFFNLRQGVVSNVIATEAGGPPFRAVNVQVITDEHTLNGVGFNVGADLTFMVSRVLGVGYFARFSSTSIDVPASSGSTLSVKVGGFQTGGGLRLRF